MTFQELEEWIINNDGSSIRLIKGGNINDPKHIIAYIGSKPKVRISGRICDIELNGTTTTGNLKIKTKNDEWVTPDIWIYGPFKTTKGRKNMKGREWCDQLLASLGFS